MGRAKSSAEGSSVEAPQTPRGVGSGCPPPHRGPRKFLHFHVEMAHFGGILAVNFKFNSMNKTVKIHQNQTDTSEYDAIKRDRQ